MLFTSRFVSGLDQGKALCLYFSKSEKATPSGLPARSVLTSYYRSKHFKCRTFDPFNVLTSPDAAILCTDSRQSMFCQLLPGLVHRLSVLRLTAVFASGLLRAITFLEHNWTILADNIRTGKLCPSITDMSCREAISELIISPNPDLADEIESICSSKSWRGIIGRLWPRAKYIEVIVTGSMSQYIPALEFYSGGKLPLVCTMYASSECYFGVNLNPLCAPSDVAYTLLPNMAYFEFIPLEHGLEPSDDEEDHNIAMNADSLVDLVNVKLGRFYELVVTTFSGLNRYRIGDVLQVVGFYNQAPQFRFICRRNVILSIDSDKTNEEELHKSVSEAKKLLEPHNALLVEYTSYADTSTVPGHYVLYWEIAYTSSEEAEAKPVGEEVLRECCAAVEESLGFIYRRCRASDRSVGALEIRVVEGGTFDSLMDLFIGHGGGSINQYKTPRCIKSSPALALLESKVLGSFFSPRVPSYSP